MLDLQISPMCEFHQREFKYFAFENGLFNLERPWLVYGLTRRGQLIGGVYLCEIDEQKHEAELGVWINDPAMFGRGYGALAAKKIIPAAFKTMNLERLWVKVKEGTTSEPQCKKLGFKLDHSTEVTLQDGSRKRLLFMYIDKSQVERGV